MTKDLLVQLLEILIPKNKVPEELSREYIYCPNRKEEMQVICFKWNSGKSKTFGYTEERYNEVLDSFNSYWDTRRILQSKS